MSANVWAKSMMKKWVEEALKISDIEDDTPQMGLSKTSRAKLLSRGETKEGEKIDPSIIKGDKKLSDIGIPNAAPKLKINDQTKTTKLFDYDYSSKQAGTSRNGRAKILGNLIKSEDDRTAKTGDRVGMADKARQKRVNKGSGGTMKPVSLPSESAIVPIDFQLAKKAPKAKKEKQPKTVKPNPTIGTAKVVPDSKTRIGKNSSKGKGSAKKAPTAAERKAIQAALYKM